MLKNLSSYCPSPKITFKDQEEGEQVLLLLRRHLFTTLAYFLAAFFLSLIPPLFLLSPLRSITPLVEFLPLRFWVFSLLAWYLAVFGFTLTFVANWFFNLNLITNKNIVDIDYLGFLFFRVSETPLGNIQDVTYRIAGLPETLFNFGHVFVQTAGTSENFEFGSVPRPAEVHDLITDILPRPK